MDCPFPGMDPWLEHPALWPGVHNRLISAIADDLAPRLAPRYFVAVEMRTYSVSPGDERIMGVPDAAIGARPGVAEAPSAYVPAATARPREAVAGDGRPGVVRVDVPASVELREGFLELRGVESRELVTAIELLSPANKILGQGRRAYLRKRQALIDSSANLIEADLLRAGRRMPVSGDVPATDYRILVSRGHTRPASQLYVFDVRDPIPIIPVPLAPDEQEPLLDLGAVLHDLYRRARFDLQVEYARPPVPALPDGLATWADGLVGRDAGQD